jgi:luciferase family oxidoreductase group 1
MRALRRNRADTEEDFPREVAELQQLLGPIQPGQRVIASPGANSHVPIWLLGSSLFSAQLAAQRGLPYAFASHFAPRMLMQAIDLYRRTFVPSATLAKPRVVVGVPLVAASTDEEAQLLASSIFQRVSGIVRGERKALQPPVAGYLESRDHQERAAIADFLAMAVIGGPATVAEHLKKIVDVTEADELMLVCDIFDPSLRLRSLEIAAAALAA